MTARKRTIILAAMTPSEFLDAIEAHLIASGETPTAFGKRVMNDPGFVFAIRAGREPRFKIQQKVLKAMPLSDQQAA